MARVLVRLFWWKKAGCRASEGQGLDIAGGQLNEVFTSIVSELPHMALQPAELAYLASRASVHELIERVSGPR